MLRLPALFTVPGDALAGAAAISAPLNTRTLLAMGSSLCLYEAGMALNDWADRDEDAVERPHRPLPSGRIHPAAALGAACALTGAGLSLAARAGRPALAVAVPLAATVWAYDLALKHTPAGPAAMATARGLDLLLGAAAVGGPDTDVSQGGGGVAGLGVAVRGGDVDSARLPALPGPGSRLRQALPSAALLSAHTLAVTTVSRHETRGGSPWVPLAALATTGVLARLLTRERTRPDTTLPPADRTDGTLRTALATAYATTAARPYFHATLNPSPPLTQRAVTGGIRATIPLQAALSARSGATATAVLTAALAPLAARFTRRVSVT
ncbi:SCO3242 family prenyltransferase [Streptomyces fulvoviolaceus]|uniref:SCO3242 family prenyltransferase n=1 Tax=Streptomyces fulvoviolaceus TaxID=285535 RepID=UPI0004C5EDE5